jgi:hypothetical protein
MVTNKDARTDRNVTAPESPRLTADRNPDTRNPRPGGDAGMTGVTAEIELALRSLAASYAAGVDRRQLGVFLSAFHPDASLVVYGARAGADRPPNRMQGHDEIGQVVDMIARYPKTFHLLGQSRYEIGVDGDDRASGEVYCSAHHYVAAEDGDKNHVMYIRYEDEYRRDENSGWRIALRAVRVDWTETRLLTATTMPQGGGT